MSSSLFMDLSERAPIDAWLSSRLTRALESVREGSATPTLDLDAFRDELAQKRFERPEALQALLEWTIASMERGAVQMTHPRYFGLFNPAPAYPAECADRVAAALNPQICVLSHAPVAVLIERHVIELVGERAGFGTRAGGHFTSGGSEANATAVACALTRASAEFATHGCRAFAGQPRIYVSNESHLAWLKIAHTSGMGRRAVRLIDTDGTGRMCARALSARLEADCSSGDVPVMIAATAGTTNAGMVDPLDECARLARAHSAWFHVDAAWGGALIADPAQHSILGGIEQADSVTIDAHKWFATTMGTGMFITPHVEALESTFHATASYMPSGDPQVDYYLTSMQWSRRFAGLRLFLNLAAAGWEGIAQHLRRGQALIRTLNETLTAAGWTVANGSDMALTCLVPPGVTRQDRDARVAAIVERIVSGGSAWVSVARYEGDAVVRVCVTNGHTTRGDIERLAEELIATAAS